MAEDAPMRSSGQPQHRMLFADTALQCAGMRQYRAALLVLEEGCRMDPLHGQMRLHLETATQGIFRDLLEGALLPFISSNPCQANPIGATASTLPMYVLHKPCGEHEACVPQLVLVQACLVKHNAPSHLALLPLSARCGQSSCTLLIYRPTCVTPIYVCYRQ